VLVQLLAANASGGRTGRPHITAVCGTTNVDRMRRLGADEVVDYTKVRGTHVTQRVVQRDTQLLYNDKGGRSTEATVPEPLQRPLTPAQPRATPLTY
jgi:hypothetical protein